MDGVHDMGGMHGFGPIGLPTELTLSQTDWRARMFGIELSYTQPGGFNLDWMRHVMECMPPAAYLSSEYFDRWYWREAAILANAGWVSLEELTTGRATGQPIDAENPLTPQAVPAILEQGVVSRRPEVQPPAFRRGDRVRIKFHAPLGATRLPRYARGHIGPVESYHGWHCLPDANAHGQERANRSTASASSHAICGRATLSLPEVPRPNDAEFTEPWQAEVLSLAIAIQEAGHIEPAQWSSTLSEEIEKARAAGDPADGTTYYNHVLAALERLVAERGLLTLMALDQRRHDWEEAYEHTPHGQPVVLTTKTTPE